MSSHALLIDVTSGATIQPHPSEVDGSSQDASMQQAQKALGMTASTPTKVIPTGKGTPGTIDPTFHTSLSGLVPKGLVAIQFINFFLAAASLAALVYYKKAISLHYLWWVLVLIVGYQTWRSFIFVAAYMSPTFGMVVAGTPSKQDPFIAGVANSARASKGVTIFIIVLEAILLISLAQNPANFMYVGKLLKRSGGPLTNDSGTSAIPGAFSGGASGL